MSRSIELSDEDYARLERAAEVEGITPAEWVASHIPAYGDAPELAADGKPARMMADVLAGRVGLGAIGRNQAGAEVADGAKLATMAERLAGRIGRIGSGSGEPSSDNVAKSFAEYLEAKQRAGRL